MTWTPARRKAFIISVLRSGTRRWPPKYETLNAAKTEKKVNPKSGRIAQHFVCNICKQEFVAKDVEVDHIIPVANADGFTTWDSFVENLYCGTENLQVVCKPCHSKKSFLEKTERKSNAKAATTKKSKKTIL